MKNLRFSRLLGVASVLSLSVALISCGTSNNLPSDANGSDIQLFTQSAKLYTSEEVRDLTTDKLEALSLGGSPENAIVPVVFAADGHLLTTTEFNDMLRKNTKTNDNFKGTKTYFTNLQTYRTMLDGNQSLKSANLDKIKYLQPRYAYALSAPEPLDSSLSTSSTDTQTEGKIYLFDAYETEYRTPAEQTKLVETKLEEAQSHQLSTQAVALPSLTAVGDFAWTNQQKSQTAISGHNGIVVALNNGGLTGGSRTAKGTMTFEARGSSGGSSANSDVKTRAQEVAKWPIGTSFGGVGRQALVGIPGGMTNNQRIAVRNFALAQDPGKYDWTRKKWDHCSGNASCGWYCSYLVWKDWLWVLGVDLDPGLGFWVYPYELMASDKIHVYFKQGY